VSSLRARIAELEAALARFSAPGGETVERLFRMMAEAVNDVFWMTDATATRVLYVSPGFEAIWGRPAEKVLTDPAAWLSAIHPEDRASFVESFRRAHIAGTTIDLEYRVVRPDGTERWVLDHGYPLRDPDGVITHWSGVARDVTDRREAEGRLREAASRLAEAERIGGTGSWFWDLLSGTITWSEGNHRVYGLSRGEFEGTFDAWMRRVHPGDVGRWEQVVSRILSGRQAATLDFRIVRPGGEIRSLSSTVETVLRADGTTSALFGTTLDVSDRRRAEEERRDLEERVRQVQKLESLGLLAGGIAHDFNNLLVGVLGNAGLALLDLGDGAPGHRAVQAVQAAAHRASDLAQQMLAYTGKGKVVVERVDVSAIVAEMVRLVSTAIPKETALQLNLPRGLPQVEGDATQLRQVAMNLITNASDAVDHKDGVISVTTGVTHADRWILSSSYVDDHLPEGEYVYVEVSDNGSGMDEATRARVFDPFFTTKLTGHGLGMSAVLGIVRGHRGAIHLRTKPGKGTTFRLLFPVAPSVSQVQRQPSVTVTAPRAWRMTGKVLVADDEPMVREVAQAILERAGFSVLAVADGRAALDVYAANASSIVAVILDLTMPHAGSEGLLGEIRRINPAPKVIISSGYTEEEMRSRFPNDGPDGYLKKPYRPSDLLDRLREAMASRDDLTAPEPPKPPSPEASPSRRGRRPRKSEPRP
jgi:two-component system cell cycle sensor histidine kinase/response regulator CckA